MLHALLDLLLLRVELLLRVLADSLVRRVLRGNEEQLGARVVEERGRVGRDELGREEVLERGRELVEWGTERRVSEGERGEKLWEETHLRVLARGLVANDRVR